MDLYSSGPTLDPSALKQYAKALLGALVGACGAAGAAMSDNHMTWPEGIAVAGTFFATLGGVAYIKNVLTPAQLAQQPLVSRAMPATNRAGAPVSNDGIKVAL